MGKPPFEMGGRPADENLPEAVQHPQPQPPMASATPLPEVVPDSSPEFAQPRHYMETDKYPVYYDAAPKFPHEPQTPGMQGMPSPGHQSHQPWTDAEHSVSMMSPNSSLPWQSFPPGDDQQTYVGSEPPAPEKRICGLRKRLFIIIAVIVALVVVGAAVGGGVGGSIAARQGSSDGAEPAETSSASSSSATGTSTDTGSTTTTPTASSTVSRGPDLPTPTISFLSNQTDRTYKGYALQVYEKNDFEGKASPIFWDEGFYDLGFDATSWIWVPNGLDACVTFCANKTTRTGFACTDRRKHATDDGISFKRVSVWRGAWQNGRDG
ncbi:predicted protein [Chaetomium globosum CBS 148.51]|uniref:Uncharacterized protein n=1 Tax=Chaetomium globosum (strain ATCC 6205 / CBS 148.51 / DSM 1962 / NBRC 6347 / NRRL 1970) TaxID=306901 RepID=Q2H867_CHAGB|nr:uncharacterized protein CHGG_03587 [Chaetomium globosum CBS 148.51]EAQ91652.1 predicted protein [Chaetomium globosum CBS 148.51]